MGAIDKLLNMMKLNDDYDDDYEDDFYNDDYEEPKPKRKAFAPKEREDDYYDDDYKAPKPVKSSKVTPMRQPAKRAGSGMEVVVIKPNSVEDAREITETLLSNRAVVLNLEGLDMELAQRIIDFTSGSTFAIDGNLQKISNYIFIITPPSVDISGDFQDILSGAIDLPSLHTEF